MIDAQELRGIPALNGPSLSGPSAFATRGVRSGQQAPLELAAQYSVPMVPGLGDVFETAALNYAGNAAASGVLNALESNWASQVGDYTNMVYDNGALTNLGDVFGNQGTFSTTGDIPWGGYAGSLMQLALGNEEGALATAGTYAALDALDMNGALPYVGSIASLLQGDVEGAAKTGIGTFIGNLILPGIGGFIGGLLGGGCFITEAVTAAIGGGDDHPVLETLRMFRDQVLMQSDEGRAVVADYEEIAPKIVAALEQRPDRDVIYTEIYTRYLEPAASAVLSGDYNRAMALYSEMVANVSRITKVRGLTTKAEQIAQELT